MPTLKLLLAAHLLAVYQGVPTRTLKHRIANADLTEVRILVGFCRAVLAALVAVGIAGCAASIHASIHISGPDHAPPVVAPGSVQPPNVSFSTGDWTATGTFLQTRDADAHPGEVITRPWNFRKICDSGSCHIVLTRETLYGFETAPIERQGSRYVVNWPPSAVPCPHYPGQNAGFSEQYSTLLLRWSVNHETLVGIEGGQSFGKSCGGGPPDILRWVARRTNPSARPLAVGP